MAAGVRELLAACPVVLAPMEDVTDAPFREACRSVGAELCVTEFVAAEQLVAHAARAEVRAAIAADTGPTAIQIYGPDPALLLAAARVAAAARPAFVDINCGCWVPKIVARGAGAAWLRDPQAMVTMARAIASALAPEGMPVTVKTRIGWGPGADMPIVELARRLEDAGVAALAIHCRTALAGHTGAADWSWAARAREAVAIPVIVNGDVQTAAAAARALAETGCAGVMIGRAAIAHPWIFREARAAIAGAAVVGPTEGERLALYRALTLGNAATRGDVAGVAVTRRHLAILGPLGVRLRPTLFRAPTLAGTLAILDEDSSLRSSPRLATIRS